MKRPQTKQEWLQEIVLWALEGNHPKSTAQLYGVETAWVRHCLKEAGTIRHAIPGRGAWKRLNFIMLPEGERVRLEIPWDRCYLTGCDAIYPSDVNPSTRKWGDPPLAWERMVKGYWG